LFGLLIMATDQVVRQVVFLDIEVADEYCGRIVIELFNDVCPRTAANFYYLCTGEKGKCKSDASKALCYAGTKFHRIIKGFMVQGGDIHHKGGIGGESIYGEQFDDENFKVKHDRPGLVSMANAGPNTNKSQFFITCGPTPHLDSKHVVFGEVRSGMEIINKIQNLPVKPYKTNQHRPKFPVTVSECGDLRMWQKIEAQIFEDGLVPDAEDAGKGDDALSEQQLLDSLFADIDGKTTPRTVEPENVEKDSVPESKEEIAVETGADGKVANGAVDDGANPDLSDPMKRKLWELRLKRNEARKLNRRACKEEHGALSKTHYEISREHRQEYEHKKKRKREEMVTTHRDPNRSFLYESAEYAQNVRERKRRKTAPFGWNIFNDDSLYRAYHKRTAKLAANSGMVKDTKQLANVNALDYAQREDHDEVTEENIDGMVKELKEQIAKRKSFQRRRTYYEDADVSYINKRNQVFNKKVERAYGKYTAQIRANLERGTAL